MLGRFKVRPDDDGKGRYGVWDGSVHGWRTQGLTEAEAHEYAIQEDIKYDAHGPRPASDVRQYDAPRPVWRGDSLIDIWIRDQGQWLGRVRDTTGRSTWVPAEQLQPGGTHG